MFRLYSSSFAWQNAFPILRRQRQFNLTCLVHHMAICSVGAQICRFVNLSLFFSKIDQSLTWAKMRALWIWTSCVSSRNVHLQLALNINHAELIIQGCKAIAYCLQRVPIPCRVFRTIIASPHCQACSESTWRIITRHQDEVCITSTRRSLGLRYSLIFKSHSIERSLV